MHFFRQLNIYSQRFEEFLIATLLATSSVVLFANVLARYIFNWGVSWAEELVRYEIIWMVFIGGSVAARQGIHIGVDILVNFSPLPFRRPISLVLNAISFVFCMLLVVLGADLVAQAKMFGQVTPALEVPMWVVQMAIPVGGGLMALRFLQRVVHLLQGDDDVMQPTHADGIG